MNDTFKAVLTLTAVTAAAGFVIAFYHSSAAKLIASQTLRHERSALDQVFGPGVRIIDTSGSGSPPIHFWIGKKDTAVIGYAFLIETAGYSGPIRAVVGIDTGGTIMGLVILSHNETPAVGGRMDERISKRTIWNGFITRAETLRPWFTEQFKGLSVNKPLSVGAVSEWPCLSDAEKKELIDKNAISAISGATVSSRAIVRGIGKAANCFAALRGARQ